MTHDMSPSPLTAAPGATASPYTPPFAVQGSCVLSEDYFLTGQVIIGDDDQVRPFLRADGTVEALLLSEGNLSWLRRDPGTTSGWSCMPLTTSPDMVIPGEVSDVAVGTDSAGNVMGVCVTPNPEGDPSQPCQLCPLQLLDPSSPDTPWYSDPDAASPLGGGLSRFRAGADPITGTPYFYASDSSGRFTVSIGPDQDTLVEVSGPALSGVTDGWLLWASSGWNSDTAWAAGIVVTTANGAFTWYQQSGSYTVSTQAEPLQGQGRLLWVGWPPSGVAGLFWSSPGYAYQDPSGDIFFARPGADTVGLNEIGSTQAALGPDTVAVWQDGGLFSFAMLFGDTSTVNVVTQYGDPTAYPPTLAGPIPLQPGVIKVLSAPADPAQGTLFAVMADATLSVLAKDPVTGWSLVPIQQDAATLQELDTWRVQLSVTDANGVPAAGTQVSVSADRPAGTWQHGSSTLLGPGAPATFTADASGRVTFAIPAVELDAPQLTVSPAAAAGLGAAAPVQVSPDAEVQAFLAGTAPLNDLGTLTPGALLTAVNADGTKLFPVLAGITDPGQQTQAAAGVAQAISQCVRAGQGATPGPDDVKSWTLDLTTNVPRYTSSTESSGTQAAALTEVESLSDWWDTVKNDAESFFHGVRHDAIHIATCTANWVKDETGDGWHWVVNLAVTMADDLSAEASYLITDITSAFHAITGFFAKLGADIAGAISWLRQNITELLKESSANAAVVEGWLTQAPGVVNGCLEHYKELADNFFTGLQGRIDQAIDDLMPELAKVTFGNPVPASVSGPAAGGAPAAVSASAAFDLQEFVNSARANWLTDKILSYFSGDTGIVPIQPLQDAMDELAIAVQDALAFAEDLEKVLWAGLRAMSGSRGSYDQATFAQFFQALKSAVADLLGFADAVVKAVLDLAEAVMDQLGTLLAHQFNEIPVVGGLLNKLGVDDTMSVAHLVSMVLMYPATLGSRIKNGSGSSLFPTAATATEKLAAAELDWALGLQMSAAVGQGIWGIIDMIGDAAAAAKQDPPPFVGWTDIVAPCILNILQWPGALNADGTTAPPFANAIDGSVYDGDLIEPTWLVGWIPPVVGLCGKAADYKPAADPNAPPPSEPEPTFPEVGMYFTAASAVAGTITGSIYNFQTGQSQGTQAAGILSNVSNVVAPFLTSEAIEASEGISVPAKLILDAAANMGAAAAMILS